MRVPPQIQCGHHSQALLRKWLADARLRGLQNTYTGKRNRLRVTWHARLVVDILDGERAGQTEYALAQDISEACLGLRCRSPIPAWTTVRIRISENEPSVKARVRHCTTTVGGYRIGLELVP